MMRIHSIIISFAIIFTIASASQSICLSKTEEIKANVKLLQEAISENDLYETFLVLDSIVSAATDLNDACDQAALNFEFKADFEYITDCRESLSYIAAAVHDFEYQQSQMMEIIQNLVNFYPTFEVTCLFMDVFEELQMENAVKQGLNDPLNNLDHKVLESLGFFLEGDFLPQTH